ncbi:hypothetical protein MPTK1_2g08330 [Marchantia polymorpha subsp. ruderalis]|uniref:Uncharacterized protein n=1 Tax=Marchantia polymorpha TaxID=3197 RepID=A0A2R6XGT2_MARPO|nr:hypothetical protein MARPO_0015s0118 [Marchantia polymorpha]BBN01554.1 hypothetical protein Mp_2g08330 [Marchantia polymorpha subsp. ruderalis]|eukprot:PTQ45320.1 hypothetical protein MARPO_0015s0118 [Marchantia polymorpha]
MVLGTGVELSISITNPSRTPKLPTTHQQVLKVKLHAIRPRINGCQIHSCVSYHREIVK